LLENIKDVFQTATKIYYFIIYVISSSVGRLNLRIVSGVDFRHGVHRC
jgi:hypothetical protein